MSASEVLNAPIDHFGSKWRFTRLWLLQPLQVLKAHSPKRASKAFTRLMVARKSRFAPNAPDQLCAKHKTPDPFCPKW